MDQIDGVFCQSDQDLIALLHARSVVFGEELRNPSVTYGGVYEKEGTGEPLWLEVLEHNSLQRYVMVRVHGGPATGTPEFDSWGWNRVFINFCSLVEWYHSMRWFTYNNYLYQFNSFKG